MLVHDYQLALVPGMVRAARPDLRITHFTHTPFCGPNSIRVLPDRHGRGDVRVDGRRCRAGSTPSAGHAPTRRRRARCSGRDADRARTPRRSGPIPTRSPRSPRRPRPRARAAELDELVGDRKLMLAQRPHRPRRRTSSAASTCTTRCSTTHPEWREPRGVRRHAQPVAREPAPSTSRTSRRSTQAAARVNERWGTRDWQPVVVDTRDDYEQTIAGFTRYDVLLVNPVKDGLNLVAKEGPLRQPARRRGAASHRRRARTRSSHDAVLAGAPVRHRAGRARAAHRARRCPTTNAPRARDAPARARRGAHAAAPGSTSCSTTAARSIASASVVEQRRQAGRAVDHDVGGDAPRAGSRRTRTPMLTPCASAPRARQRVRARRRRGGRRRRRPRTPRPHATARELGDGRALVDRHRRPQLHRHAAPQRCVEAERAARPRRPTRAAVGPRSGWSRQWMVTATLALALHQQPGQRGVGVVGGLRDRVDPRPHAVVDAPPRRRRSARARRRPT